jgi:hypothetical protein
MKQITRMTVATLGTAALLAGSGGIALAARQTATITSAAGTVTAAKARKYWLESQRRAFQSGPGRVPDLHIRWKFRRYL